MDILDEILTLVGEHKQRAKYFFRYADEYGVLHAAIELRKAVELMVYRQIRKENTASEFRDRYFDRKGKFKPLSFSDETKQYHKELTRIISTNFDYNGIEKRNVEEDLDFLKRCFQHIEKITLGKIYPTEKAGFFCKKCQGYKWVNVAMDRESVIECPGCYLEYNVKLAPLEEGIHYKYDIDLKE